jgi:hypothetical protein
VQIASALELPEFRHRYEETISTLPAATATIDVSDGFFEQLRLGFSGTAIFVGYVD